MNYTNPVLFADFSDPDVIRAGKGFYMVASSFNYAPAVPVLYSENLAEWKLINYVSRNLPFEEFGSVVRGGGVWAPSLRLHNGIFYCVMPVYGKGIYVSETDDPSGKWSEWRCLVDNPALEDPCPVWADGRCYLAVAFAGSKAGFNSVIALYETDETLTKVVSDGYKIIYDGHNDNPTIEGPKFYRHDGYFYILAPAGGVKSGWQTALRSRNVYGPYESKIILTQGDSPVNGPHQGALIDLPDGGWAFMHFQYRGAYGRIVHLQPVTWSDGWPLCGKVKDALLAGEPVESGAYPVDVKTDFALQESDFFEGDKLSLMWQTPANKGEGWYSLGGGLKLYCVHLTQCLNLLPDIFTAKIMRESFTAECAVEFSHLAEGDETGLCMCGGESAALCLVRDKGIKAEIKRCSGERDEVLWSREYRKEKAVLSLTAANTGAFGFVYSFALNGEKLPFEFSAVPGKWVGAKTGIYARNAREGGGGYAVFRYFKIS